MLRSRRDTVLIGLSVTLLALATAPRALAQVGPGPGAGPGPGPGIDSGDMPGLMPPGIPGMGGGQGNPVMILLAPSVQKELKLSDDQKSKVYSLARMVSRKGRELFQMMAVARGDVNPQAMIETGLQLRQDAERAASKILDPKQKERLDQIALRAEGPLAVARPEIAAKLRLNSTQNEYVQGIMMQMRQELFVAIRQGVASGQPVDPGQVRMMVARLREGAVREVSKVIDRKQKDAFNKMLGEPFDVSKIESEMTASFDPNAAPPASPSSSKPGDSPQAKDAPAAEKEKEKK